MSEENKSDHNDLADQLRISLEESINSLKKNGFQSQDNFKKFIKIKKVIEVKDNEKQFLTNQD